MSGKVHDEEEVAVPEDLAQRFRTARKPKGSSHRLPAAHRRAHAIAIERLADTDERAERVEHTMDRLLERHAP